MEDKGALGQPKTPNIAVENDGRTISVQVLEFKTSLLEAVEELHIHRVWCLTFASLFWLYTVCKNGIVAVLLEKTKLGM